MQEQGKYKIGEYTFQTFHEYRDGQEDVRKIECINKELNIQDPEVAVRLYNDIRSGKIVFKSPIGDQFFAHLADIVADKSVDLLEDKAVVEEAEGKVKYQKILGVAFIILALVSFAVFGIAEIRDIVTTRQMQKLADQVETPKSQDNASKNDDAKKEDISIENGDTSSDQEEQTQNLSVLPEYEELLQQNPEMVGWLSIDDTEINYPVVQKDNTYYLTHGFDQATNSNGSIFMDERCSILKPTIKTIIYGHNMISGMMFGGLINYLQEGYLDAHKYINFNTIYEKRTYEIVAVGLSKVQYQDEDAYRYYDFITSTSAQDLEDFIQNVDSLAVYGNADGLTLQDKLLTLSTCNSYTEDGRLFVVAKQVQ